MSYNLDRAEKILQSTAAGRRDSETWFLQGLLQEIDPDALLGMSPAQLFQDFLRRGKASERIRWILTIVARPFEQPDQPLRPGDVMLRAIPGTGDIGHVMVLVSSELRTPCALAAHGITAESATPGQYGTVIEAGAFPHDRSAPYARRWLDGRGRVPPNSLILRPSASPDDPYLDLPAGVPARESADNPQDFSAPAWLKVEGRSRATRPATENMQPFELRHRREEDEQKTRLVRPEVGKDDALPLPFEEPVALDGAEDGVAEVAGEWLAPSTTP
jgi:hypothetical protein